MGQRSRSPMESLGCYILNFEEAKNVWIRRHAEWKTNFIAPLLGGIKGTPRSPGCWLIEPGEMTRLIWHRHLADALETANWVVQQ